MDLEAPSLLPFGYTIAGGGAIFLLAGKAGGERHMCAVKITPRQEPLFTKLQFGRLPDAIPNATCVWSGDGAPELILNWTLESGGITAIVQGRVNAFTGELIVPPHRVFTTDRRVQAAAFPPSVAPGEQGSIQLLLAAKDSHLSSTQTIFDISNLSNFVSRDLPDFDESPSGKVERWVLPSTPYPTTPVLAVSGNDIWTSDKPSWRLIASGDLDVSSVRLWAFSARQLLCTWFDKSRGYRWRRLNRLDEDASDESSKTVTEKA